MELHPLQVFRNRTTGHWIVIQGAVHIGTAEYYADMRDVLDDFELRGYKVHYEQTKMPKDDGHFTTPQEQEWLDRISKLKGYNPIAEAIGLLNQKSIRYEPTWENHDVNMLEMLRLIDDPEKAVKRFEGYVKFGEEISKPEMEPVRKFYRWFLTHRGVIRGLARMMRSDKKAHARREEVAVAAAVSSPENVIMLWGEAHLLGLGRRLIQGGYMRDCYMEDSIKRRR